MIKKLILFIIGLLIGISCNPIILGQEITCNYAQKDIKPYPLLIFNLKVPTPIKIESVDWQVLNIDIDALQIVSIKGYINNSNNDFIFTGPPGNYLIQAFTIIGGKNTHASMNITIPDSNSKPPKPQPSPEPDIKPAPIADKTYVVMVTDPALPNYINSGAQSIYNSTTIGPALTAINPNLTWRKYTKDAKVNNNTLNLSDTPWGAAAIDIINKTNNSALVTIDINGKVTSATQLPRTEQEILNKFK